MGTYEQRFGRGNRVMPKTPVKMLDFTEGLNQPGRGRAMDKELNDVEYLRDLAERLRHIPVMYGTDDGDIFRLQEIARMIDNAPSAMEG